MNVFIYNSLTLVYTIAKVTTNVTIVPSQDVSVIVHTLRHLPLVHEVVGSYLAGGRKFSDVMKVCHTRLVMSNRRSSTCVKLTHVTKMLCSSEHKLVCGQHKCY